MGDYGDAMMRNQNAAVQARTKAQNRANVMQLKLIGQSHPTGLTTNLLKLFEPRPPLEYKPPPEKRKCPQYTGMAQFVSNFAEPSDPLYAIPVEKGETPAQRRARIHQIRLEEGAKKAAEELEKCDQSFNDPNNDPNISGDPYKTLFVARLNYETTESRVKREFEAYGPIKRSDLLVHECFHALSFSILFERMHQILDHSFTIDVGKFRMVNSLNSDGLVRSLTLSFDLQVRLVMDKETSKPRGYAFIEYVHTRDMKAAYKQADGRKIDNRRVLVDVERGRTVPNWRPRRLGGGLGTTRVGGEEVNHRVTGRNAKLFFVVCYREQMPSGGVSRSEEPRVQDERDRDRDRDYEGDDADRGRSRDREYDYDNVDLKHGHEHGHYDYYEHQGRGQYANPDSQGDYDRYREPERDNDRYDQMDEDGYGYDRAASEPKDDRRATRSRSRDYEY
ncbi:hypothetical protein DH2020_037807 [Rehmannia glutinosa]|uniref:RRM domain-containing protein n=1 Tax=Rehmannia glutinosa TaxID=99300 RepID=A0ABR0V0B8_REHGL